MAQMFYAQFSFWKLLQIKCCWHLLIYICSTQACQQWGQRSSLISLSSIEAQRTLQPVHRTIITCAIKGMFELLPSCDNYRNCQSLFCRVNGSASLFARSVQQLVQTKNISTPIEWIVIERLCGQSWFLRDEASWLWFPNAWFCYKFDNQKVACFSSCYPSSSYLVSSSSKFWFVQHFFMGIMILYLKKCFIDVALCLVLCSKSHASMLN